jgi:hypothetical protein
LQEPLDSTRIAYPLISFQWSASSDVPCDTLRYFVHLWSDILDTTIGPLTKSPFYFDGRHWYRRDTTYYWTVLAADGRDTSRGAQGVWRFFLADTLLPVEGERQVPHEFVLHQNYPNPFNPSTSIRYGLPQRSTVSLSIFNTLGQRVATLVKGEQEAGYHEVMFNATGFSSGIYFYRMTAGNFVETKKLLLLR